MMIEPDESSYRAVDKYLFADTTEVLANTVIVDKEVNARWRIKVLAYPTCRRLRVWSIQVLCHTDKFNDIHKMFSSVAMSYP